LPYNPNVVVVQVASPDDIGGLTASGDLQEIDDLSHGNTYELAITDGTPVSDVIDGLRTDPGVVSAEPDWMLSAPEANSLTLTADPKSIGAHLYYIQQMYFAQWSLPLIDLGAAQSISTGNGTTVAVVDTGVQTDHPGLASRLVPGYDFLNHTPYVSDPAGGVDSGHGTFVAGLIAATAPGAFIMPIRVLDPSGQGDEVDVAKGIYYAVDHGANIVNLSLGAYTDSSVVDSAVLYAELHNVIMVAASGNDNTSALTYPAATNGVIAVSATDSYDQKASFSNYGDYITLSAPGVDLYSTYDNGAYASGSGTSFAAALVSGVAALGWSAHPDQGSGNVISQLEDTSKNIDALNPTHFEQLGAGRIDAAGAVGSSGN
jgi:subtilisin family serine protease